MDCPQCGGTLVTYALSDQEASVCEDCGYVGIPAEHRGEPDRVESWDDALRRFYRTRGTDGDPSVELQPPLSRPSDGSGRESWDDALRRFRKRRTDEPETAGEGTASDDERAADDTEGEPDPDGTEDGADGSGEREDDAADDETDGEAEADADPERPASG
ncbi:MAG: hypothetical protein ABEI80_00540 [Haloplanus sp.]